MPNSRAAYASAGIIAVVLFACGSPDVPGQRAPPPNYVQVAGTPDVFLNPDHEDTVGSEFDNQLCLDANPDPPGPGEVGWHFVLPQSVEEFRVGGTPGNIFASLTVTFTMAGTVTLTVFGPPSDAHAYFTTPTDDTLESGEADIYRHIALTRGNESNFNLGHTCAPEGQPTTTSTTEPSTTTSTTTSSPTTTSLTTTSTTTTSTTTTTEPPATSSSTTTTAPTTSTSSTSTSTTTTAPTTSTTTAMDSTTTSVATSTTDPAATTTTTTPVTAPSTSVSSGGGGTDTTSTDPDGGGTTTLSDLPVTGTDGRLPVAALVALSLGIGAIVVARRPPSSS